MKRAAVTPIAPAPATPTLQQATRDATRLAGELERAARDVAASRRDEADAISSADVAPNDAALTFAARQRLRRESMERREKSAQEALSAAETLLRGLERQAMAEAMESELVAFRVNVGEMESFAAEKAIELDRQLDALLVEDVAVKVVELSELRARLATKAAALGRVDIPEPYTVATARFVLRQRVAAARGQDQRDDFSSWLATPPSFDDWRLRGMSASEAEAHLEASARARAQDQAAAIGARAGLQAAIAVANAQPVTATTPNAGAKS